MYRALRETVCAIIVIVFCSLCSRFAMGADVSVRTAQEAYTPGDTIRITADVHNNRAEVVDVVLECLLTSQTKKNPDLLVPKPVTLGADESRTMTVFEIYVTQEFPADEYRATVTVTVNGITEGEREVSFLVQGTLKETPLVVHLCGDVSCRYEPSVFMRKSEIYMAYESSVAGLQVEGDIYFEERVIRHVILPAVFETAEAGSYLLMVTASKEGYKTESREVGFAVVERNASIARQVKVDIKPGSDPNGIDLSSGGIVPVAILTTAEFDSSAVKPVSVSFAGARPVRWVVEDVDRDGDLDLLFFFNAAELKLGQNSTEATLTGVTYEGEMIEGTDSVKIVPKRK